MTSPTNAQPTPPVGYEILSPEVAKMKPEGMRYRHQSTSPDHWDPWLGDDIPNEFAFEHYWFSAPLGTTALLLTPGPEATCNCYCRTLHANDCPRHPRNAYVKVLPGWLAGLPEKPEGLVWANHMSDDWTEGPEWFPWDADSAANATGFIFAVPRHVYDAIEAQRRPWSRDPIHDEVAKMDESKLQGEQPNAAQQIEDFLYEKYGGVLTPKQRTNICQTVLGIVTPPPVDGSGPTAEEMWQ